MLGCTVTLSQLPYGTLVTWSWASSLDSVGSGVGTVHNVAIGTGRIDIGLVAFSSRFSGRSIAKHTSANARLHRLPRKAGVHEMIGCRTVDLTW